MAADAKFEKDWKEGDDLMRKARESASTTLFRWTPDWERAATDFEAAAKKYMRCGAMGQLEAVEAYKGAAEAHVALKSLNSAARCMEAAALGESKIPNSNLAAAKTYRATAELYRDNEQTAKAAATYLLGANLVKDENVELTTELMIAACELFENDTERALQATDTFKTTIAWMIKADMHRDAIMMIDRLTKLMMLSFESKRPAVYRNHLCIIIIALALQDVELAFNNYERFANNTEGFLDSEQSSLANELLVAFDECDDARLAQTLKDSTFNLLDAPIARIARTLSISEETRRAATARQKAAEEKEFDMT